jgi:hypothetical protein
MTKRILLENNLRASKIWPKILLASKGAEDQTLSDKLEELRLFLCQFSSLKLGAWKLKNLIVNLKI